MADKTTEDGPRAPQVIRSIAALAADLAKVGIAKSRENREQHFKFRGIDQVMNTLAPLLVANNLIVSPAFRDRVVTERPTKAGGVMFNVVLWADLTFISAIDGSRHTITTPGEGQDSADKATNKAMSIAYKYAMFLLNCIPLEPTDDPDSETPEDTHREPDPTRNTLADLTAEFELRSLEAANLKELADLFAAAQAELKKAAVERKCEKPVFVAALGALTKTKDTGKARLEKRATGVKEALTNPPPRTAPRGDEPAHPAAHEGKDA